MLRLRSQSFRRYRIEGKVPSPLAAEFAERLHERRFRPLSPHEDRTYGWVSAHNLLLTRFDADTLLRGDRVAFAVRIDTRRVPPRLLRAHLDVDLAAHLAASERVASERAASERAASGRAASDGAGGRVSREERKALRDEVVRRLRETTSPTVEAHTVLVDPRTRTVLVQSLSKRVQECVAMLFEDTFNARLDHLTPWRRAQEILGGTDEHALLEELRRTEFGSSDGAASTPLGARRTSVVDLVPEERS